MSSTSIINVKLQFVQKTKAIRSEFNHLTNILLHMGLDYP